MSDEISALSLDETITLDQLSEASSLADTDIMLLQDANGNSKKIKGDKIAKPSDLTSLATKTELADWNKQNEWIADLNNFTQGTGAFNTEFGSINTPFSYGNVIAFTSQGYLTQIATDIINANVYFRRNLYGTWTNWDKLILSHNLSYDFPSSKYSTIFEWLNDAQAGVSCMITQTSNATDAPTQDEYSLLVMGNESRKTVIAIDYLSHNIMYFRSRYSSDTTWRMEWQRVSLLNENKEQYRSFNKNTQGITINSEYVNDFDMQFFTHGKLANISVNIGFKKSGVNIFDIITGLPPIQTTVTIPIIDWQNHTGFLRYYPEGTIGMIWSNTVGSETRGSAGVLLA